MKTVAYLSIAVILAWTGLALCQLWLQPFSAELFFKLTISCGLGLVAIIVAALIYREYQGETDLKKDKYID